MIACGGSTSEEGFDRDSLKLDQHVFLTELSRRHALHKEPKPRLVIAAFAPGAIVAPWAALADSAAIMFLAGQAHGDAWARVLLGDVNPSGKLPLTIPHSESDTIEPCKTRRCKYSEGLHGGWRSHIGKPVTYPFGHGLSYTTFKYTWLAEPPSVVRCNSDSGGSREEAALTIAVQVENSGGVAGAEVVQLYLKFPPSAQEPPYVLRGFAKTPLLPPHTQHTVHLRLSPRDLSTFSIASSSWQLAAGSFTAFVGSSSRDFRLTHPFQLKVARSR